MDRARRLLLVIVLLGFVTLALEATGVAPLAVSPATAVTWPASGGLLLAEVVTGGTSASDEYVEVTNAGTVALDLGGLELVYASSSGGTTTRKVLWPAGTILGPGRHLLVANSAGSFAATADATYSGGLASTGGAVFVRPVGGTPIDAVGWGDATNAFVEGTPTAAPAARQSIERRLGGALGNTVDSNDNLADWFVQATPVPQNLNAPAVPGPSAAPTATPPPSTGTGSPVPTPSSPGTSPSESAVTSTPAGSPSDSPSQTPEASSPGATPDPGSPSPSGSGPDGTPLPTAEPTTPVTPEPTAVATPEPTGSTTPEPTPLPTPMPTPEPTPEPTSPPSATATATPEPTPAPTPIPTAPPTPTPTATPTPPATESPATTVPPSSSPTPTPIVTASPTPVITPVPTETPAPTVAPLAIAAIRALADGQTATLQGVLTTALGALESGRAAFVQDASGGIGLYLDAVPASAWPRGSLVRATGTVDDRYGQRVLRVALASLTLVGSDQLPAAAMLATGVAGEADEGRWSRIEGQIAGAPGSLVEGVSLYVDDGSGQLRVVISTSAAPSGLVSGARIRVTGPLGQHATSSTGGAYRLYATEPDDIAVLSPPATLAPTSTPSPSPTPRVTATPAPTGTPTAAPSPTPSATPRPSASPTPVPTPSPSPTPRPTATPAPTLPVISVHIARLQALGQHVRVAGVVTAEAGRLGDPDLIVIQDADAGIVVRLPDGAIPPARNARLTVIGALAAPYGQLEIRPASTADLSVAGDAPPPESFAARAVDETTEGLVIVLEGTIDANPTATAEGDLTAVLLLSNGTTVTLKADSSSGIGRADLERSRAYRVIGIAGQRATATGRLDGYRVWLRDRADFTASTPIASATPSGSVRPTATPPGSGSPAPCATACPTGTPIPGASLTIAAAIVQGSGSVTVEGIVTTPAGLFDTTRREVVIQDASAAILVRLPSGSGAPKPGNRLRVTGEVGRAYGAPRIVAATIVDRGTASMPAALVLRLAPSAAVEWRLVRASGTLVSLHRSGATWLAELDVAGTRIPIDGLSGSGIGADRVTVGRSATITGIVRRPWPTATDRRFAIVPRSVADIVLGATITSPTAVGASRTSGIRSATRSSGPATTRRTGTTASSGGSATPSGANRTTTRAASLDAPRDSDFGDLAAQVGWTVRVGGLVVAIEGDELRIDDGTAEGRVRLQGDARAVLPQLTPGTALNATGRVVDGSELAVEVADPAGIAIVSDPESASTGVVGPGLVDPAASSATAGLAVASGDPIDPAGSGADPAVTIEPAGAVAAATTASLETGPRPAATSLALLVVGLLGAGGVASGLAVRRRRRPRPPAAHDPATSPRTPATSITRWSRPALSPERRFQAHPMRPARTVGPLTPNATLAAGVNTAANTAASAAAAASSTRNGGIGPSTSI